MNTDQYMHDLVCMQSVFLIYSLVTFGTQKLKFFISITPKI